jgi:4-diphosphocytidyl-2C-methyl-D-erythritol kinase
MKTKYLHQHIKLKAYAKINLTLKVFPKKEDDTKHKVKSLIAIYKHIYDEIFIEPSNRLEVRYFVNNTQIKIPNDIVTKSIK